VVWGVGGGGGVWGGWGQNPDLAVMIAYSGEVLIL